ncbi:MAG: UDP-N-acetylglucosamine 2-epimerase (non-hydrolyzing) [Kiritimatiellae bacterium]|nr:UDP-N-acetylglucosamine 2-epimerase (non-hydrolyzing) [Kiritimatiellia bacterium]
MKITSVVGARPNFMKIAPFARALNAWGDRVEHRLVHTGQHYDAAMSHAFFEGLRIPRPDVDLEIGSGSHAEQVGRTMIAFERDLQTWKPDWVVVVGDVNATLSCAVTARKAHIRVAHIEAGLRSFDMAMPEEINRLVTDRLSNLLFTTDRMANDNLAREGVPPEAIRWVGNVMIDTLDAELPRAAALDLENVVAEHRHPDVREKRPALAADAFGVVTLHRPSNVDHPEVLGPLTDYLVEEVSKSLPLIWSVHPRTVKMLQNFQLWDRIASCARIALVRPVGYHEMLCLNRAARLVLTDSGGMQEECCVLGTPCVTLRWNTERPITLVEHGGTNRLAGNDPGKIRAAVTAALSESRRPVRPPFWDGHAAERIAGALAP